MAKIARITADGFTKLIAEARAGSGSALGEVLQSFLPMLLAHAKGIVGRDLRSKVDPSDLVQQTFVKAVRHLGQFHGQTQPQMFGWLRVILNNNALTQVRFFRLCSKREVSREVGLEEASNMVDKSNPVRDHENREVKEALDHLPPRYALVLHRHYFLDETFVQIAREMKCSPAAVEKVCHRAMRRLNHDYGLAGSWG